MDLIDKFCELAKAHGIPVIIDSSIEELKEPDFKALAKRLFKDDTRPFMDDIEGLED